MATIPRPDLSDVDWDGLSAWGTRLAMASMGWCSDVRLERRRGADGVEWGVWLKHHAWHATLSQVCLHSVRQSSAQDAFADVAAALRRVACLARRAWDEFPDSVPCQALNGSDLVQSAWETENFRTFGERAVVMPERACPTEALPGWPGHPSVTDFLDEKGQDGDGWLRLALDMAALPQRWQWNDSLSWVRAENGWRYQDRRWHYEAGAWAPRWNGVQIGASSRNRMSTDDVSALGAACLAMAHLDKARALARLYPHAMPPEWTPYVPQPMVAHEEDEEAAPVDRAQGKAAP